MKTSKKLLASVVAASAVAAGSLAPVANAEVSASVGVASTYLWRGYDLGSGTPAVSGDLSVSSGGFYTGIWASSGDTSAGTEFDLYIGYGGEVGDFSYDVSVWNYVYPTGDGYLDDPATPELQTTDVGDLSDLVLSVGYGPVALTYYDNIAGGSGYTYTTLSASFDQFSVLYGAHDGDGAELTHIDVSYAYNDNLSFTVSTGVDSEDGADVEEDTKFVVSYSLPIE